MQPTICEGNNAIKIANDTPYGLGAAVWSRDGSTDVLPGKHTHLTVDVVKGRGSGFPVEAPEGVRFMIRSRLFTDDGSAALNSV